ncbi:glycosyltransferase family 39 protein [Candidatus Nanohalococcus occultus]|uniref:Glycosyltransferase of PMT family n=1 Tax=Candidatus Nanohalococcus occultus TaxID=2978047 RepID=A0ABY8CFQ9_9ARCH|nr:Glycosyltransferase of PMT family [Candidatus Nanohaloarchaeota archaeon SVXNc]
MKEQLEELTDRIPDKRFLLLLGILVFAGFLRFKYAFFEGMWIDEGRYGRIAASVSQHLWDYSTNSELYGQITGHPPVYPYLLAISVLIFGNNEFALRIVSPIVSLATIALIYKFGAEIRDRETGLIAAALLSVNPIFWFLSERILIGVTLTFMYTATMLAFWYGLEDRKYSKYSLYAAGPLTLLTVLTKQPGYALGAILPLYFVYRKQDAFRDAWKKRKIRGTALYRELTDRKYYISAGLGILTITPWMLRNMSTCGFPLCSFQRALSFAGRDVTNPAVQHIQGLYFFVSSLPLMLTLPVAAFIFGRLAYAGMKSYEENAELTAYKIATYLGGTVLLFVLMEKLVPMFLLAGLALFTRTDFEKLGWIWAGIGIGFMSIPATKDPRYIVFTMPALILTASLGVRSFTVWLSNLIGRSEIKTFGITALIVLPMVFMGYNQGLGDVQRGGYSHLEPAGDFIDENAPLDSNVAATSNGQFWYYIHPRMAYMPPNNESEFQNFLLEKNISYVEVDVYEPMQPQWTQTGIAPYRLPNSVRAALQSGEISQREAYSRFSNTPEYLTPVRSYGETRSPISSQPQPVVIVYRVERGMLE